MTKKYPPGSIGSRMIDSMPVCSVSAKISDVLKLLNDDIDKIETINYIYITDSRNQLAGVLSIKDVFRRSPGTPVKKVMIKNLVKARAYADSEQVAIAALKHNLKSIPVVDKNNKLIGIVPSDAISDILHTENVENFLKVAGIHSPLQKIIKGSPLYLFRARIPWLILGLFGGVLGATIIKFFEGPLQTNFILASFIPLMLYMAGAVGNQTETLLVRSIVLDNKIRFGNYLFRELKTTLPIALVLSGLLFLISLLLFQTPLSIGIILATSLFVAIFSAVFVGVLMPNMLVKLKKDPAIGSGPFATIIRDILSLLIYFGVSTILLSIL